jgi:hydrophobe/amphiphile efflux-1 (HAE1) family protein
VNISEFFIRRPIATVLFMGGLFLVGLAAYPALPVAPLPDVDFPTIQITADLPGAGPETMASSVAAPLERTLGQIPGVTQLTSTSMIGNTSISIQFGLNRNIDAAAQDVQSAITAANGQLPKNLPAPPTYRKVNPADLPVFVLAVESDTMSITELDDYADTVVAQQISQLDGVGSVRVNSEQKPAIRVQVDPAHLAAMGLTLEDVRAVLGAATVDQPKGSFEGPAQSLTIYANDQMEKAALYDDLILAYRNGAPVKVRDVGRAVEAAENARNDNWNNNRRGMTLVVIRQPGANVIEVTNRIEAELPRIRASLPPSVTVTVLDNRTHTIKASVEDVETTLTITVFLVVAVIFLFLRSFWATAIPAVAVPLSLVGTFAVMYVLGYSIDNLSLMALTIAIGFVVDDAIVMLENIVRHIEAGSPRMTAAIEGAREIGFTIVSISVSLVAVFIPILLMGGIVGRLFHEFAVTVSVAIGISALVSLTLTPMMAARVLRDERHASHGQIYLALERFFDFIQGAYARGLRWVLRHQAVTLAAFFATTALSVLLFIMIPKGFFPQQDTGFIPGVIDAAQDISIPAMKKKVLAIGEIILADPAVHEVHMGVGNGQNNSAFFVIDLKPRDERDASADEIIRRLRAKFTKIEGAEAFMQSGQDITLGARTARTQFQYTLTDTNLDELSHWGPILQERMASLPALRDVASDLQNEGPTAMLTVDRATASRFGIQMQTIDDTLADAFGQRQVNQFFTQVNQYHVILEVSPELLGDPASLEKIYLRSPVTSGMVPLSTFVKIDTTRTSYMSVNHQGQLPAVTLTFNLALGYALGDAVSEIEDTVRKENIPATVAGSFQGTAQAFQSSLASQPYLIAAAIIAVYIVLGMLYESFVHPLTILSTLPSAGVGALLTLLLVGGNLDVIAMIGILLLIGIVKKNAIMMIDFALTAERERQLPPRDAIYEACLARFRPIMMTTMAAMFGGVPLMLGHGAGSELRQPLGYTIVGGLALSQALTLFSTPVIYLALGRHAVRQPRLSAWLSGRTAETAIASG